MRYIYLVQSVPLSGPPPQKLMEAVGKLALEYRAKGNMIADGGLAPLSAGARIRLKGGKIVVTDGPFAETKEVIGGFAIFEWATREEALSSAVDFMELHRLYGEGWEGVCEMREIVAASG